MRSHTHILKNNLHLSSLKLRIEEILPWCILVAGLCMRVFYFWKYEAGLINSDAAAQMVLANILNQENALLYSENFYYSTQIFWVSEIPMRIGLAFFQDWHTARALTLALMLIFNVFAYVLLAKSVKLSHGGAWSAIAVVCTLGTEYYFCSIATQMYGITFSVSILIAGLCILLIRRLQEKKQCRFLNVVLCAAVFLLSTEGIRFFMNTICPLLGAAVILTYFELSANKEKLTFQNFSTFPAFIVSLEVTVLAIAGYVYNIFYLTKKYGFVSYGELTFNDFRFADILQMLDCLPSLFGYKKGTRILSVEGICSLSGLVLFLMGVICLIRGFQRWRAFSLNQQFLFLFCYLGIAINIVVPALSDMKAERYLIPAFLYVFPAMHLVWDTEPFNNTFVKSFWKYGMVSCLILVSSWQWRDVLNGKTVEKTGQEQAVDWLVDNGYTQGYAYFWEAASSIEMSDNQLDIWAWTPMPETGTYVYPWLQQTDHVESEPEGTVFVLLNDDLIVNGDYLDLEKQVYSKDGYSIYVYESAEELQKIIANN